MMSPRLSLFGLLLAGTFLVRVFGGSATAADDLELSDEYVPYEKLGEGFIERPRPVTEVIEDAVFSVNRERQKNLARRNAGDETVEVPRRKTIFGENPFLGVGQITPGFETPFGAVWQPSLIVYGEYRTAIQTFNDGDREISEWANRLDLFTNLYLTPTERISASAEGRSMKRESFPAIVSAAMKGEEASMRSIWRFAVCFSRETSVNFFPTSIPMIVVV